MFSFLQPSNLPVVEELENHEVIYASNQHQYNPLRTLRGATESVPVLSRWKLSEEQMLALVQGADIYIEMLTFGNPLQPIRVAVGRDVTLEYISEQYGF